MKLPNLYTQRKLAEARNLPPRNEPFAAFNVGFHETYTRLVEQVLAQLGDSVPVVVLIADDARLLGRWRNQLGGARWAGLYVVICGAHQPRYREAACQYFGRLLHEPEGSAAERENRLVYGESLADVDAALNLLARHIVESSLWRPAETTGGPTCRRGRHRTAETLPEDAPLPEWRTSARTMKCFPVFPENPEDGANH